MELLDWDVGGRTVWAEGRGEIFEGQAAIAWTIKNRLLAKSWYGNTIYGVCRKRFQYSCWNPDDPNYKKLQALDKTDSDFQRALCIFGLVMSGDIPDPTGGATHYHTKSVDPKWNDDTKKMVFTKEIGSHRFYVERLT